MSPYFFLNSPQFFPSRVSPRGGCHPGGAPPPSLVTPLHASGAHGDGSKELMHRCQGVQYRGAPGAPPGAHLGHPQSRIPSNFAVFVALRHFAVIEALCIKNALEYRYQPKELSASPTAAVRPPENEIAHYQCTFAAEVLATHAYVHMGARRILSRGGQIHRRSQWGALFFLKKVYLFSVVALKTGQNESDPPKL